MRKDFLLALVIAVSGLIWTIAAYVYIPDVAVSLSRFHPPIPLEHGMPVWSMGLCWMSSGLWAIASIVSRRVKDFERAHAVVSFFLAVLFLFLVGWLTWI